jgi:uncharacterized membrane protein
LIDFIYRALANLGYSEPLQPVGIHIPMGLLMSAFVFVLVARIFGRGGFSREGYSRIVLLALVLWFPAVFLATPIGNITMAGRGFFPLK